MRRRMSRGYIYGSQSALQVETSNCHGKLKHKKWP